MTNTERETPLHTAMTPLPFLKKAEAEIRARLRKYPPLYALVGGVGIVLFWRGIWYGADYFYALFVPGADGIALGWPSAADGLVSIVIGSALLLSTGLFVSELAGGETILREEKKEEQVVKKESSELPGIEQEIRRIEDELKEIHNDIHHDPKDGSTAHGA